MDLSAKQLTAEQLAWIQRFIVQKKLLYQPFKFSEDLEVGAGQHFILNTIRETIHWKDCDPSVQEHETPDLPHFREHNAHLRSVYEYILDRVAEMLGDLKQLTFAEIGCNTGYFLYGLELRGAKHCIGFDFTPNEDVFRILNELLGTHCEFHFAEWDSLKHELKYAAMPEVDVCLSVAVTCHLADPVQHLAYLCDRSRKAVFVWSPVSPAADLSISFGNPAKYANALSWPLSFDNEVRPTPAMLRLCLSEAGFKDIREIPVADFLPESWRNWYHSQKGYLALRTENTRTALSPFANKRSRDVPPEVLERYSGAFKDSSSAGSA